ncbi:hypothetical protein GCM10009765_34940 [Fodinicola feengrottensis]|uniref:Uncharacterized protein n=1 Tax=Fodinicola feengrottensis TaxID=435914 RepID=A0ABN2H6G7_9ACTN
MSPTATDTAVTFAAPLDADTPPDEPPLEPLAPDVPPLEPPEAPPPDEPPLELEDPPKDSATVCEAWAVPVAWTVSETVVLATFAVRYVGLLLALDPVVTAQAPPPTATTTTTTPAITHAGFSRMRRCIPRFYGASL